ncbi:MAG TPA: LrgB family protein [Marinilabiliaceae bacterium]|nr:LrgB family protein [Marinilabiliaceae bacterium]
MEEINALFENQPFTISFVLGVYIGSVWLYKKLKVSLLHPVLVSILVIVSILSILKVEYASFEKGSFIIDFLLGPSVVALGFGLYEQSQLIRKHKVSIFTSIVVGSIVGIVSVSLIAKWLGANEMIITSLQPKSVTTPIAILISKQMGGIPPFTAVVVMITGVFGAVAGPFILDKAGISSRIARGLAMGSCAHGVGTARAVEMGAIEGVISGLSIGLMGLITSLLVPLLRWVL